MSRVNERKLSAKADALLHPVRMRIVKVLQAGNKTPSQIAQLLPDVAQATLYRHIARLDEAGIIKVVERHQVHGTVERVFSLVPDESVLNYGDLENASPEELIALARIFFGEVASSFERYFRSGDHDLTRDNVVMYERTVHLSVEEAVSVRRAMRNLLERHESNPPGNGRKAYSLIVASVPETDETTSVRRHERAQNGND